MIPQSRIDELAEIYSLSDNVKDFKPDPIKDRSFHKRDLVEAKVMIDRWGTVTTDWIFHTSKKEMLLGLFPEENDSGEDVDAVKSAMKVLFKYAAALNVGVTVSKDTDFDNLPKEDEDKIQKFIIKNKQLNIWGTRVHFIDTIPASMGMGVALKDDGTLALNDSDNIANSIIVFVTE